MRRLTTLLAMLLPIQAIASEEAVGVISSVVAAPEETPPEPPAALPRPVVAPAPAPIAPALSEELPPPPRASFAPATSRFGVLLGMNSLHLGDPGAGLVVDTGALMRVETGLRWSPAGQPLGVELLWLHGSSSTQSFGAVDGLLTLQSVQVMASWHTPTVGPVRGYARGGTSLDFASVRVQGLEGIALHDSAVTVGVEGTGGLELLIPLAGDHQVGRHLAIYLDVGYAARLNRARFDGALPRAEASEPERIGFRPVDLGSLGLSGLVWRLGAALRI